MKNYFKSGVSVLYLVSFVEGGALMAVELLGAKMVAPYYGVSIYVWTAVLATTLGGLAAGYFTGGFISEKAGNKNTLYAIIALSGLWLLLLPSVGEGIMDSTLQLDLRTGVTLSCLIILTPSVFLFGTVSPLIVKLLTPDASKTGKVAGKIYGISTVGGIIATFLMGFYMIPYIGIQKSLYISGAILLLFPLYHFLEKALIRKVSI